jgi:hypothetical protein
MLDVIYRNFIVRCVFTFILILTMRFLCTPLPLRDTAAIVFPREYELMTEAHGKLFVVQNCSRSSLCVSGGGKTAGGRGVVSSSWGWGKTDSTQGDRIWRSLGRQKVKRGLLLIIHILWCFLSK